MKHTNRLLVSASLFVICSTPVLAEGDAVRGQQTFNRCSACHSVDGTSKSGPALNGVFGRNAGAVEGYNYSAPLKASNITWNDETLETYLAGPSKMVRGTRMTISVARPEDRANIIAYLKTLAAQ